MNAHDDKAAERLVARLMETAASERALANALVANGKARGSHSLLHERHIRFYNLLTEAAAALAAPKEAGDALEKAWHAICNAADEVDPDWMMHGPEGADAIVALIRRLAAPSKEAGPELFPGTYESLSKLSIRQENPDEL